MSRCDNARGDGTPASSRWISRHEGNFFLAQVATPIWQSHPNLNSPPRLVVRHVAALPDMAVPKANTTSKSTPTPTSATAVHSLWKAYNEQTSDRLKFIDAFLLFIMLSGALQFSYCILVTNFPFNAFLAGYACCVYRECCILMIDGCIG